MPLPLVLGVCEDDLERDLTFLKEFAGPHVDIRITPMGKGCPGAKQARLLRSQLEAARRSRFEVKAFLVHGDADGAGLIRRREEMLNRFRRSGLEAGRVRLIRCVPDPCTEAWLCRIGGIAVRGASPAVGCGPWKRAWERRKGHDLDRVRRAARDARGRLGGQEDFDQFMNDWRAAGLP